MPGQSRHVFGARCGGARFRPQGVGIAASRGRARRCARRRRRCRGRRASCNARRVAACARSSSRRVNVYGMVDKTSVVYINNVYGEINHARLLNIYLVDDTIQVIVTLLSRISQSPDMIGYAEYLSLIHI